MTVMVKYISCLLFVMFGALYNVNAQDYLISTPNTSLLLTAKPGEAARIHYYGTRIEENRIQQILIRIWLFIRSRILHSGFIRIMIKLCR